MWEYCWGFIVGSINTMLSAYFYSTKRSGQAITLNIIISPIMNTLIIILLPRFFGNIIVWHTFGIYELLVLVISFGLKICSIGTVFIVAYNLVGSIFRVISSLAVSIIMAYFTFFHGDLLAGIFVMIQGIIGAFAVRLPVSWFMSRQAGVSLFHIGLATPASSLIQIILCVVYFLFITYRERNLDRKC
ncbi:MAG: hypothetical protein J5988_00610 [Eubacterium sp.]|nr:hypothetical protein [Eubacterium sp.]